MKHKFASKIVFLSILLALMFSAVGVVPAEAAGNFTHPEVARMALGLLPASELATLLNTYQGYVLAGSVFPDWGYGVEPHATTYGYYSDVAHLWQFSAVYLDYFNRTYSPPYSDEAKKSLAFLFGVLSHQTADAPFHSSFLPYVYVNETQIFGTPGEQDIEVGVDVFNMFDRGCWNSDPVYGCLYKWNWISWDIPIADVQAVYDELFISGISVKSLTTSELQTGWNEYQTEATLLISGETQMYTYYLGRLPNTHGFYYDYPYGGMTNMANLTVAKWQETWNALGATVFVKPIATGTGDCSSWDNACALQTALGLPYLGGSNEVWVMQGVYKPTANSADRTATFQLLSGVSLYGGFAGDETLLSARHGGASILSGDIDNNDTNTDGNNIDETYTDIVGNNSYHVVRGAANATLNGFVVTGGQANGSYPDTYGGGMFNWPNSNPTIANVTFSGNSAQTGGGCQITGIAAPRSRMSPSLEIRQTTAAG